MSRHTRRLALYFCAMVFASQFALATDVDFEPPANYYMNATGTGATLKAQLTTAMSAGHIQRTYGNFRDLAVITDADPTHLGNIWLVYSSNTFTNGRQSVSGVWDPNPGAPWNREHTWPDSLQPQDASTGATGAIADPHMLRPSDPTVNTNRGNLPYGLDNNTGNRGAVSGGYYFPGDLDKGDMARTQFYAATRWSAQGFTLVEGQPSGTQMGDLSSMINWHYLDGPDTFERRRNQAVYSQGLNPLYYSNNRNAYVDHPEWVWSVFVGQNNNSQISLSGATVGSDGSSTRNLDLGRVFVGGAVPGPQNVMLNKGGNDGTYYSVTTNGAATSSVAGRFNAFKTNATDSRTLSVGLSTTTATAGLKTGTVTIDNLDITTGGGSGHGAGDANDVINLSLAVLDHARPSFDGVSEVTTLDYDFGSVATGSSVPAFEFDVSNLVTTLGATANLDFDSVMSSGDASEFTTDFAGSVGALTLAAGMSHTFHAMIDTAAAGMFAATYTLSFSDENITGALTKTLMLTLEGEVTATLLAGDYNRDGFVDAADYTLWRDSLGASGEAFAGADGDGNTTVDMNDYHVWTDHFGESAGGGAVAAGSAVPEPGALFLLICGCAGLLISRLRRYVPTPGPSCGV